MTSDEFRNKDAQRKRESRKAGREIGDIPPVADSDRKERAIKSLRFFAIAYFPGKFSKPFSPDHEQLIAEIEERCLRGGLKAFAMPRGSGKTTICEVGAIWAVLTGHQEFVMLIGASKDKAQSMMDNIKAELAHNPLLLADFPEVCKPIHALEGETRRCAGQLHHGELTLIQWGARQIVLPTIPGSKASGAILRVAGLAASIRGANFRRPGKDGATVRPTFVIIDDPQTDKTAKSPKQCADREATISGGILGLAGPGRKIAAVMPCTVIRRADLADNLLTRSKHPDWHGTRTKLVYQFPEDPEARRLWQEYGRIRADDLEAGGDGRKATRFYAANREQMDKGSKVSWPERYNPDEISALQHAYNLKLRDPNSFAAEYQNDPEEADSGAVQLDPEFIVAKLNGHARGSIPVSSQQVLTAFVDVQQNLLFWTVVAWSQDMGGSVVDYGTWPPQKRRYFTLREASPTIAEALAETIETPPTSLEGQLYAALDHLAEAILARDWKTDTGVGMPVSRCLVDANWGRSTDTVYRWCRQTSHRAIVYPSHGMFVGPRSIPFANRPIKDGDRKGQGWRITSGDGHRGIRYVLFDSNAWKCIVADRLLMSRGDKGGIELFDAPAAQHRLIADHFTAESRVKPDSDVARKVDIWQIKPGGPDNHWWDCIVGAAVAASIQGASPLATVTRPVVMPKRRTRAERVTYF